MNFAQRAIKRVDHWQQHRKPAAFSYGVVRKYGDDNAGQLAASLTYTGFITLFPLLLVLATILGLLTAVDPGLRHSVNSAVSGQFPLIGKELTGNVKALQRSSVIGLIVGLVIVIWGTTGLAQSALFIMAQLWNIPGPKRPTYVQRLGRTGLFLIVLLVGVLATTVLASLATIGHENPALLVGADAVAVIVNIGMYVLGFRVLTPRLIPTRELVPGAIMAGILWTVLQAVGALVVKHFLRGESVYGIFAIVLALVAWIYLVVQITLYAAEVNVVLARKLYPRSMTAPPFTEADRSALVRVPLQTQRYPEQHIAVTFADQQPPTEPVQAGQPGEPARQPTAPARPSHANE
jgi:YihY family inner membrane protein